MAQNRIFRGTARAVVRNGDVTQWIYHDTAVVTRNADGSIRLDSGGWKTETTKRAMNQASNENNFGFKVYAKNGDWFVFVGGCDLPFEDGMILTFAD